MRNLQKLFYVACVALCLSACEENYNDKLFWPGEISREYGSYIKPYKLDLTYSGEKLIGKTVSFKTEDSETGTLTLNDIIPGEVTTPINNIRLFENGEKEAYTFSGTNVTMNGATVKYEGSVTPKAMKLSLNVLVNNANNTAQAYKFPPYSRTYGSETVRNSGASYVNITAAEGATVGEEFLVAIIEKMATNLLDALPPHVLSSVTLEKDGNIQASYTTSPIDMEAIMEIANSELSTNEFQAIINQRSYSDSPNGLAYWSIAGKNDLLVQVDVASIISLIAKNNGQTIDSQLMAGISEALFKSDPIRLKSILSTINLILDNKAISTLIQIDNETFSTIFFWLKNGIPLKIDRSEGHTFIYVTKETITPIITAAAPIINESLGMDLSELLPMMDTMNIGLDLTPKK